MLGWRGRRGGAGPIARAPEELGESAVRLQVSPDHAAVVGLERLGHAIHERPREAKRIAHFPHSGAGPIRDEVADHPRVLRAVALVDVLDDLLSPLGAEVDVDVRVRRAALVDEPFEQEVVADRVNARDPERVCHDRIRRATSTLGGNALSLRELHEVPADEEELGKPRSLHDVEFVGQLPDDRRRNRVIAPPDPGLAQLDEIAECRLTGGHGEPREAVALEPEVHGARGGNLDGRCNALHPGPRRHRIRLSESRISGRHGKQLRARLQM